MNRPSSEMVNPAEPTPLTGSRWMMIVVGGGGGSGALTVYAFTERVKPAYRDSPPQSSIFHLSAVLSPQLSPASHLTPPRLFSQKYIGMPAKLLTPLANTDIVMGRERNTRRRTMTTTEEIRYSVDGSVCMVWVDGEPDRCPTQDDMDRLPVGTDMTDDEVAALDD